MTGRYPHYIDEHGIPDETGVPPRGSASHDIGDTEAKKTKQNLRIRQEASDLEDATSKLGYSPEQSQRIAQMHLERNKVQGRPLRTFARGFLRDPNKREEVRKLTPRRARALANIDEMHKHFPTKQHMPVTEEGT